MIKPTHILPGVFLAFCIVALIYPVGHLLWMGGFGSQWNSIDGNQLWGVLRFTYLQAFLSALCAGIVGTAFAFLLIENNYPGKTWYWRLASLSFSMPTLILILALVGIWGKSGWLGKFLFPEGFYGWKAILLAHTLLNFSLFLKMVGQSLQEMDRSEEKVALSLGMRRLKCFLEISFKKVVPAFQSAFVLSFLYCSSSLLVLLLLGGGPKFSNLEVGIFQAVKVDLDIPTATFYALIQMGVCLGVQFFRGNSIPRNLVKSVHLSDPIYFVRNRSKNRLLALVGGLVAVGLILLPIVQVMVGGFASLSAVESVDLGKHLTDSIIIAMATTFLSVLVGICAAYSDRYLSCSKFKKLIAYLCELPVALSSMILGLGLIIAYRSYSPYFRSGIWGVTLIQSTLALPLVFRVLQEGYARIEKEVEWSAQALGAGPWQRWWWVELPLLRNSLVYAAVLSAGLSLGEVGSLLLFESQSEPLSLWLYRLMATYHFNEAQAVGLVLLILMAGLFLMLGKWEYSK